MDYKINTKHKDRLFCFLFGNEKYKKNTLSLYNVFGNRQIKLPTPGYVVFYNGNDERPAMEKVRLSDAL